MAIFLNSKTGVDDNFAILHLNIAGVKHLIIVVAKAGNAVDRLPNAADKIFQFFKCHRLQ